MYQKSWKFINNGKNVNAYICVTENAKNLTQYVVLQDILTKEHYKIKDGKVIISEKMAKLLGNIKEGENITIYLTDTKVVEVTVSHIIENYAQHYVYMSSETYKQISGKKPEYNVIYFIGDGFDNTQRQDELAEKLI